MHTYTCVLTDGPEMASLGILAAKKAVATINAKSKDDTKKTLLTKAFGSMFLSNSNPGQTKTGAPGDKSKSRSALRSQSRRSNSPGYWASQDIPLEEEPPSGPGLGPIQEINDVPWTQSVPVYNPSYLRSQSPSMWAPLVNPEEEDEKKSVGRSNSLSRISRELSANRVPEVDEQPERTRMIHERDEDVIQSLSSLTSSPVQDPFGDPFYPPPLITEDQLRVDEFNDPLADRELAPNRDVHKRHEYPRIPGLPVADSPVSPFSPFESEPDPEPEPAPAQRQPTPPPASAIESSFSSSSSNEVVQQQQKPINPPYLGELTWAQNISWCVQNGIHVEDGAFPAAYAIIQRSIDSAKAGSVEWLPDPQFMGWAPVASSSALAPRADDDEDVVITGHSRKPSKKIVSAAMKREENKPKRAKEVQQKKPKPRANIYSELNAYPLDLLTKMSPVFPETTMDEMLRRCKEEIERQVASVANGTQWIRDKSLKYVPLADDSKQQQETSISIAYWVGSDIDTYNSKGHPVPKDSLFGVDESLEGKGFLSFDINFMGKDLASKDALFDRLVGMALRDPELGIDFVLLKPYIDRLKGTANDMVDKEGYKYEFDPNEFKKGQRLINRHLLRVYKSRAVMEQEQPHGGSKLKFGAHVKPRGEIRTLKRLN